MFYPISDTLSLQPKKEQTHNIVWPFPRLDKAAVLVYLAHFKRAATSLDYCLGLVLPKTSCICFYPRWNILFPSSSCYADLCKIRCSVYHHIFRDHGNSQMSFGFIISKLANTAKQFMTFISLGQSQNR